jgi:hypothetical protein
MFYVRMTIKYNDQQKQKTKNKNQQNINPACANNIYLLKHSQCVVIVVRHGVGCAWTLSV